VCIIKDDYFPLIPSVRRYCDLSCLLVGWLFGLFIPYYPANGCTGWQAVGGCVCDRRAGG